MSSEEDTNDFSIDDEQIDKDNWGKESSAYYQKKRDKEMLTNENIDGDAEEAQRIQKDLLSNLKTTDFVGDEEFEQLMKKTKEAPPEETEEFALKKFNEMIEGNKVQIEGTDEERNKIIKEMYPELMERLNLGSKLTLEKYKEGGVMGKFTQMREKVESGSLLTFLTELLCKGDGRQQHPIVEESEQYQKYIKYLNGITKRIGKQTIQSFYDGTYKEQETSEEEMNNDSEEKRDESLEEGNEVEEDNENEEDNEEEEDGSIDMEKMDLEDALDGLLDEEELNELKGMEKNKKKLQEINQPNIDETDKANWIDNDDFDSDEVELEEKLLAELAASKQGQRKASGEEDAAIRKKQLNVKLKKKEEKEEVEEEKNKISKKELEHKRRLRLTKAEREEESEENQHKRPVDKVVAHGRGLTRGRKPQNSRQRIRKRYEKRTRKMANDVSESKTYNYTGEKHIHMDGNSTKLDY